MNSENVVIITRSKSNQANPDSSAFVLIFIEVNYMYMYFLAKENKKSISVYFIVL